MELLLEEEDEEEEEASRGPGCGMSLGPSCIALLLKFILGTGPEGLVRCASLCACTLSLSACEPTPVVGASLGLFTTLYPGLEVVEECMEE